MSTGKSTGMEERSPRKADITPWAGDILQLSIPMMPPLRRVNSYVLPDTDGNITIIDPGPRSAESEQAWEGALMELGMSWDKVSHIVVTHHHPDHFGLAGWMQSRCGCPVWMSERAYAESLLMWGAAGGMKEDLPGFLARHGLPAGLMKEIRGHLDSFEPQVTPLPEVSYIHAGVPFIMGGREWLTLETGGHAPGHLSFYHKASGQILCGDAVLPQISPNVSLLPGSDSQPLLTFMEGLRGLAEYPVSLAFAGHRKPFSGFNERTRELLRHHEERLDAAEAYLAPGPLSAYEMCGRLFGDRVNGIHQLRFAMSETLAHLAELVRRGRASEVDEDGKIRFRCRGSL